ncbi:MAG: CDP-alcohol phosphatidyltransferase family protein [Chloroflexi bacterium]|nr:CDP-alcohol phosphatidyltransferase family protein [Chloroflexota bacterium]
MPALVPALLHRHDPSPMARLGYAVARRIEPRLSDRATPNQVTVVGFGGMVIAGLAFYLAGYHPAWFIVAELGVITHWLADHLDGHLARTRGLTSDRGLFLDMYLDMVSIVCLMYGIASASYSYFPIFMTYLIVALMRGLVLAHWVHFRQREMLPLFGLADAPLLAGMCAGLTWYFPGPVVTVGALGLGWFDVAAIPLAGLLLCDVVVQFFGLVQALDPPLQGR